MALYEDLRETYGPQNWWPARHSFEMCAGAILVQNTAWANARSALENLRRQGADSVVGIASLAQDELAQLIRPSGYYNQKAAKLAEFCEHVLASHGGDLAAFLSQPAERLRSELLGLWGIGEETADSIVLYAAKQPAFVVDTYTVRTLSRIGLIPAGMAKAALRAAIMAALPRDASLFAELHALIIQHGKSLCRSTPRCDECPLLKGCRFGGEVAVIGARPVAAAAGRRDYWSPE